MPIVRPINELRNNTTKLAELAHSEQEPIIITKNGYADLVLISSEAYERKLARLELYDKLAESQAEVESGEQPLSLDEVFNKYKKKYGADVSG